MAAPSNRPDRVLIKGLGLHLEGEGKPAFVVAICGTGVIVLGLVLATLGGGATLAHLVGHYLIPH